MTIFGFYEPGLDVTVNFRQLGTEQCLTFVSDHEELPKAQYITLALSACIANLDSDVRPALARMMPIHADYSMLSLYNGCIMLNPILDVTTWTKLMSSYNVFGDGHISAQANQASLPAPPPPPSKPENALNLSKAQIKNLPKALKAKIIGQDAPIDEVANALSLYQAGLSDPDRPIGVFLFCGPSGVGKTSIAQELHNYLFDSDQEMVRIDCGEYQHKHENQKLLGSPAGYIGHDEGGLLFRMMKGRRGTVFLIDEVEKAHPDLFDTFLKAFDKGFVDDAKGNTIDFRNTIFILTSNLGNKEVSDAAYARSPGFNSRSTESDYRSAEAPKREMLERVTWEHMRKFFRPEFLNRLDEVVIFNHLSEKDYSNIASIQMNMISEKLVDKEFGFTWTKAALDHFVKMSVKAMEGARSMERVRRKEIEGRLALLLNSKRFPKGKVFKLDVVDDKFTVN